MLTTNLNFICYTRNNHEVMYLAQLLRQHVLNSNGNLFWLETKIQRWRRKGERERESVLWDRLMAGDLPHTR